MKRHYELFFTRNGLESLEEFSPELYEKYKANIEFEDNDGFEDHYLAEDEEMYKISFDLQSRLEPDYYYTAIKYFNEGKDFSFLIWQDFYRFISEWLVSKGFCVRLPFSENGFINIETIHHQESIGSIKCIWLLKKISPKRIVGMKVLRELEYLVYKSEANKGMLVTTSILSKKALSFIKENNLKYEYIDGKILKKIFQKEAAPL